MKPKLGQVNFSKKLFTETINAIASQWNHDDKCREAFNVILPEDRVFGYDNHYLELQLLKLLKTAFNDDHDDSWIDYFIYELDFGVKYIEGCVTEADGINIDLSSPYHLYKYLIKNIKEK